MNTLLVFKVVFLLLNFLIGGIQNTVMFESIESKTKDGEKVFNKISLKQSKDLDIWEMNQSHDGYHSEQWDKVQIKVYKDANPISASYHQLKDGQEIEYKASCFRCHSGGPRLIRPNYESNDADLSLMDKLKILEWNMLIKSYGEVVLKENNSIKRKVSIYKNHQLKEKLIDIKSCSHCHYQGGPRSVLTEDNIDTIKFLVKNKKMPPWPYEIDKKDRNYLNELIYGF